MTTTLKKAFQAAKAAITTAETLPEWEIPDGDTRVTVSFDQNKAGILYAAVRVLAGYDPDETNPPLAMISFDDDPCILCEIVDTKTMKLNPIVQIQRGYNGIELIDVPEVNADILASGDWVAITEAR